MALGLFAVCLLSCQRENVNTPAIEKARNFTNANVSNIILPNQNFKTGTKSSTYDVRLDWDNAATIETNHKCIVEVPLVTYPKRIVNIAEANGLKIKKRYATINSFLILEYADGQSEPKTYVATVIERGVNKAESYINLKKSADCFITLSNVNGHIQSNDFSYGGLKESTAPLMVNLGNGIPEYKFIGYQISYKHLTKGDPIPDEHNPEVFHQEVTCPHCGKIFKGNLGVCPECGFNVYYGFLYCVECGHRLEDCTCGIEYCENCNRPKEFCICDHSGNEEERCPDCRLDKQSCVETCGHETHRCTCGQPE